MECGPLKASPAPTVIPSTTAAAPLDNLAFEHLILFGKLTTCLSLSTTSKQCIANGYSFRNRTVALQELYSDRRHDRDLDLESRGYLLDYICNNCPCGVVLLVSLSHISRY